MRLLRDRRMVLPSARSSPPDLILLDIMMPNMDGYEVCKQLKADEHTRDIPVIFLSALREVFDKVKAFSIGGVDYITKPFQAEEILVRVETHLSLRKLQKRLKETFGIYVAQEVRDEVLAGRIPLDGEMKDVTVLFADLRDFTPLTESTPPKEVVRILNDYFTEMAPAIHRHHGSILRYVGDEIYAVFGAPLSLNDHPNHAVEAALDMRRCLNVVNRKLEQQGYAPRSDRASVSTPVRVVAANIGSPDRLSYDLVGDTVNLASRIQELTKMFSTDIIISASRAARTISCLLV